MMTKATKARIITRAIIIKITKNMLPLFLQICLYTIPCVSPAVATESKLKNPDLRLHASHDITLELFKNPVEHGSSSEGIEVQESLAEESLKPVLQVLQV